MIFLINLLLEHFRGWKLLNVPRPRLRRLNSSEERGLCRSPCSLFSARSLFCREILFSGKQTGFGTESQSFKALIWPWDPRDRRLPMTTLPSPTSYFWFFSISNQLKYLNIFSFFFFYKKKQTKKTSPLSELGKRPLADVFLLVLSQFRLSHIRPLGVIYSLIGFCMCSVQTFLTVGHLIIMDKHHGNYGPHATYVKQMLWSSPSANQLEACAEKNSSVIWIISVAAFVDLWWARTHTHPNTQTHTNYNPICQTFVFQPLLSALWSIQQVRDLFSLFRISNKILFVRIYNIKSYFISYILVIFCRSKTLHSFEDLWPAVVIKLRFCCLDMTCI